MTPELKIKLQKILALTTSPIEGEAAAAAGMLQRLLTQHNLDMADVEAKGGHTAPGVEEQSHDLGKAAFKWKLDLANVVAKHFYCESLVDYKAKSVMFLGRPDNVESMRMLYSWLIGQIKRVSATERAEHHKTTGEHVDPLRWQVNFGLGVVSRLGDRLEELKRKREATDAESAGTALVISHASEISDYMERTRGYRMDGRDTQAAKASRERWAAQDARLKELKATDIEAYYAERPWERPLPPAEQAKADARTLREERVREKARQRRWERSYYTSRRERALSPDELRKRGQARQAEASGGKAAADISLEPFLKDKEAAARRERLKG